MTKLQLLLFAWIAAWVLAECFSPGISYAGKLQASMISIFATGFAIDVHRLMWRKLRFWMK